MLTHLIKLWKDDRIRIIEAKIGIHGLFKYTLDVQYQNMDNGRVYTSNIKYHSYDNVCWARNKLEAEVIV